MDDHIRAVLTKYGRLSIPVDGLAEQSDLFEAGMTSHTSVTVMLGLENVFDVQFPAELQRRSTFVSIAAIRSALEEIGA